MRRIAELDGVRGLAAVTIVTFHMFMNRLPWGWAALDVFFVLSGFLITGIVLEHGRSPGFLPVFYARRGLRIWPLYYLLIVVMLVYWVDDPRAVPYYLTYTQQAHRYWGGVPPLWTGMLHTWTLALEEQFYLIWPALVLLAGRRWTGPLALGLAAGSIALRGAGVHCWLLAGRCDGFALGAFLATVLSDPDGARARRRALAWAVGAGALALPLIGALAAAGHLVESENLDIYAWHITIASLISFAVVALVASQAGCAVLAPLRAAPVVYLGSISYGLYLFHFPITLGAMELRTSLGVGTGPVFWAAEALLALVAAVLSRHLIEQPILRLKDLVPYRSASVRLEDAPTESQSGEVLVASSA